MSDVANNSPAAATPPDAVGWEESLSREIESLATAASGLAAEWERRFGNAAFANPNFLSAYLPLVRNHSILGVFRVVHVQTTPGGPTSDRPFEARYEETARGIIGGAPAQDSVQLSPFDYLDRVVALARSEKAQGLLADPEPVVRILKFAKQLADLPALSGFRIDLLDRFPSRTDGSAGEAADRPKDVLAGQLPAGRRFRQYEIIKLLGAGGFAEVYLAFNSGLKEHRAIKAFVSLPSHGPERERIRAAFYEEAQTHAKLKHENIVRIYEVDDLEGCLLLIMEYVEGKNLRTLIEERKKDRTYLTPREIIRIALDAARGLAYAHSLKIIHRDLKPENILINQAGVAMISDFGLAKSLDDSGQRRATRMGSLIGTPEYMAPEQVFKSTYNHQVDLYALGAVLYHMACGEPPFRAKDTWAVLEKQRSELPVPVSALRDDFPDELERITLKLLTKKPEDRYGTAEDLIRDLEACAAALPTLPLASHSRRRRRLTGVAALAGALFLAAGGVAWRGWDRAGQGSDNSIGKLSPAGKTGELRPLEPNVTGEKKDPADNLPSKKSADGDLHNVSAPKEPGPKSTDVSERKPEAPAKPVPFREQLLAAPPRVPEAAFVGKLVDVFAKHRAGARSRAYGDLTKDIAALSGSTEIQSEFATLEAAAATDLARLAGEFVQARFQALALSKDEVRLKLSDGTTAQGIVDRVEAGSISLVGPAGARTDVAFGNLSPEEFLVSKSAPIAELAFQALSGNSVQALTSAVALEKSQEKIVLWYPFLARLARLHVEEKLGDALVEAVEPLAKGERGEQLTGRMTHYATATAALDAFGNSESAVTSLFEASATEFDHSKVEREAASHFLHGRFSKVLAAFQGSRACPLAAKLLLADFLVDFEAPVAKAAARKTDELVSGGGWSRYEWKLHPDEKTFDERQQFWQLDDQKDGSILRDPAGPRSLIMHRPHPRVPSGAVLRFEFEPLGEGASTSHWRLLVLGSGGKDNYLRFDQGSVGLLRKFTLGAEAKGEALASAALPRTTIERKSRTYVLIPGEDGFHLFVDGDLVVTLPKSECILPTQLQVAVYGGRLYMKSVLALTEGKK